MALATFTPNASDGYVRNDNASNWAGAIAATSGTRTVFGATAARDDTSLYNNVFAWRCARVFYCFDTSSLGASASIASAKLKFYGYRTSFALRYDAYLVQHNQANPLSLATTDFTTVARTVSGGVATLTTTNTWLPLEIDLNATALGWIDKEGWTKLALIGYYDHTGITPPAENAHRCGTNFSEDTTYPPPTLEVTYDLPTPSGFLHFF
jgi:hypothetical protein